MSIPLPNLRITKPRRHQPRECFQMPGCLGTDSNDSPCSRGVIYRLGAQTQSRTTQEAPAIAGSTICDSSCNGLPLNYEGRSIRRSRTSQTTALSLQNHVPHLIPHPCSHVQRGSCSEQAIKKSHLTRDSRQLQLAQRGSVGTPALQLPRRPRGSVVFDLSSLHRRSPLAPCHGDERHQSISELTHKATN